MMFPLQLRPDAVAAELLQYGNDLTKGMAALSEIGDIEVGCSSKQPVYRSDKIKLYRFDPQVEKPHPVPVLIVYALVNRPYMADLQDGRSIIQGFLRQGLDVYLIDWGYPDGADLYLTLDDYINGYVDRCVDCIRDRHELEQINLLGICQGGTFSLCYTALHQEKIRNLITTVTPVDFHTPGNMLTSLVRNVDIDLVVKTLGNMPGEMLNWVFLSLKPDRLMGEKYVDMVDLMSDRDRLLNFLRMEKWIFDSPDLAGEAYRDFIKQFYQGNALVKGEARIGTHEIDLSRITVPVLNVYALKDHLVPPESSMALEGLTGTGDYSALEFPGGHIGLYVSESSQKTIPPHVAEWLKQRS